MGNYVFRLPDIGEGVAEAEIIAWRIKVGDHIEEDQATVDVMTDKATVEMTTPVSGRVLALHGEVGQMVPVGTPLIEMDRDNAAAPSPALPEPEVSPTNSVRDEAPLASPATRRRAHEHGIDLRLVPGTGPAARITPDDLDAFIARGDPAIQQPASEGLSRTGVSEIRITGLRRKIAERMQDSKRRIPHFGYVEEFDLTELESLRRTLNETRTAEQLKLSLLPFFMLAITRLTATFPQLNARFDDVAGILRVHDGVHVGIATQTAGGLMVPVVRHAETLDLWGCARELARVTAAARDGSAARDELTGSTITLTSLGALGGVSATPVINAPEVAIIGPNKLIERPVVLHGQITIRTMMNVSSSFDHRIVDGHDAARFVQALKRLIEHPALLFMES
ncbi:dihydrolipoamide acetyltransferase family protein [Lichenicoccus sp.]|uniref:dihydrolipoamide acetyltransferase family protein n=1 Tax=Lichenicoccus sp. TaxID=2781899 RepID=UPI003D0C6ECC